MVAGDLEERLRRAFADELQWITSRELKHTTLPPPAERPNRHSGVIVAAVVAVFVIAAAGVLIALSLPGRDYNSASTVTVTSSQISVQNATIPIPHGLATVTVPEPGESFYHFCLVPNADGLDSRIDCVNAGGIDVRIAKVGANGRASGIPGLLPPRCPGYRVGTSPMVTSGTIGSVRAILMTITCGQGSRPASLFWELEDRTLIVQSPFNGTLQGAAKQMVAEIDLHTWPHRSLAATAEAAATTGESPAEPTR